MISRSINKWLLISHNSRNKNSLQDWIKFKDWSGDEECRRGGDEKGSPGAVGGAEASNQADGGRTEGNNQGSGGRGEESNPGKGRRAEAINIENRRKSVR